MEHPKNIRKRGVREERAPGPSRPPPICVRKLPFQRRRVLADAQERLVDGGCFVEQNEGDVVLEGRLAVVRVKRESWRSERSRTPSCGEERRHGRVRTVRDALAHGKRAHLAAAKATPGAIMTQPHSRRRVVVLCRETV